MSTTDTRTLASIDTWRERLEALQAAGLELDDDGIEPIHTPWRIHFGQGQTLDLEALRTRHADGRTFPIGGVSVADAVELIAIADRIAAEDDDDVADGGCAWDEPDYTAADAIDLID